MLEIPVVHCPKCGRGLRETRPLQNDSRNHQIKRVEMKCGNCTQLGLLWEVTLEQGFIIDIKYLRALFRDFDHRS